MGRFPGGSDWARVVLEMKMRGGLFGFFGSLVLVSLFVLFLLLLPWASLIADVLRVSLSLFLLSNILVCSLDLRRRLLTDACGFFYRQEIQDEESEDETGEGRTSFSSRREFSVFRE